MADEVDADLLDRLIVFSEALHGHEETELIQLRDDHELRSNSDWLETVYRPWVEQYEGSMIFIGRYILKEVLTLGWIDRGITYNETTGEMAEEDIENILSDALRTAGLS